jgi:GAF domain protein
MKTTDYTMLCKQLKSLAEIEKNYLPLLANASALLNENLHTINWVGFYLLTSKNKLVLAPFQGKVACVHIEIGKGVCGTSVKLDKTLLVENVHEFDGHIACDSASESEIVIPIHDKFGNVKGVLDIDSPIQKRFDENDKIGLEAFVKVLEENIEFEG